MKKKRRCTCRGGPEYFACVCTAGMWNRGSIRAIPGSGCFLVAISGVRKDVAMLKYRIDRNSNNVPKCPNFLPPPPPSLFPSEAPPAQLYPLLRPNLYTAFLGKHKRPTAPWQFS